MDFITVKTVSPKCLEWVAWQRSYAAMAGDPNVAAIKSEAMPPRKADGKERSNS